MPGQHFPPAAIAAFIAFVGFMLYRRYRRTVGRQALVPGRLMFQVGLLGVAVLLFLIPSLRHTAATASCLAGLLVGGLIGSFGLRLTRFERTPGRDYYTPNTYIGLAVFCLFLARLAYRYVQVSAEIGSLPAGQSPPGDFGSLTSSPLTAASLLLVLGYYLIYEGGLLLWYRRNPPGKSTHKGAAQPDPT